MDDKLRAEPADSHSDQIRVRNDSFDSTEQVEESVIGQDIVEVAIGQQQDTFLLLVDVVYLDQLGREDYLF